jgi:hypothetical protein
VSKTDFSDVAKTTDIIINPGANKIQLFAKVSRKSNIIKCLNTFLICLCIFQVLQPGSYRLAQVSIGVKHFELLSPRLGCRYRFAVKKEPPSMTIQAGNLVAGIEQLVSINLNTGSNTIDAGMKLLVRSSLGMKLKYESEDSPSDLSTEISIPLPPTDPFTSATVTLAVKAELGTQKDSTLFEHRVY